MPKQHKVTITTQMRPRTSVEGEARRAGMGRKKGWFAWFKVGEEPQRGRPGRFAIIDKLTRRVGFGNRYKETVRDSDTGELMHHCDEPLDQHQGHGSARPNLTPDTATINFSGPSFHVYASHYYESVQYFRAQHTGFSPVPYALLCRAIELELKSRHLADADKPDGPKQRNMKDDYSHNLEKPYDALPAEQKILSKDAEAVLRAASKIYISKRFDYVSPYDAGTGFSEWPKLEDLDAVAKKLLMSSPAEK